MKNKMIRKANYLIEASYKLSAVEQKIIAVLSTTIRPEDEDFKPYPIKIKDFLNLTSDSVKNYEWLEKVIIDLKSKNLKIIYPDNDGVEITINTSWIFSTKHKAGSGVVELCFDPKLKPFFLQLKNRFTNYRLRNVITLKSQFSIRLYELLKQYEKIGQRLFEYSELRSKLGIDADQYRQYGDFKKIILVRAQREVNEKTDISFTFEEVKVGHGVGKLRFFIKSKSLEISQLANAEVTHGVPIANPIEVPKDEKNEDFEKLVALLPDEYRLRETIQGLLKKWLANKGFDYVARNIEYANDGSNAVNPGANLTKGSNYRVYLSKALTGDFGFPFKEDNEAKKKVEEAEKQKAREAAGAQKQKLEQAQIEKEKHERIRIYQQSLPPEALEHLREEAFSRLEANQQEAVRKKGTGSEMLLKIMIDKISLERMNIS